MATTTVSGMAASIRAATDNETFDLAGHDVSPLFQFDAIGFFVHSLFLIALPGTPRSQSYYLGYQHQ